MKKLAMILGLVLTATITARAQTPATFDIARNADGRIKYLNQADAIQYCVAQGEHLPSARELAQFSTNFGAKGIVDSCGPETKCYLIQAINVDGSSDSFNFNYVGYNRPSGDFGLNVFWTSSRFSGELDSPLVLDGLYDFILDGEPGGYDTFGCLPGL